MSEIIERIKTQVHDTCFSVNNMYGGQSWQNHVCVVVRFASQLAEILGADMEIVQLSGYLHDYAANIDIANASNHHIIGARLADELLTSLDYPRDRIEQIKTCITEHRNSVPMDKSSIESVCVSSADAMAHIDQIPSLMYLCYKKKGMTIEDGAAWIKHKLTKSWGKMCPTAQDIMRDKYNAIMCILG